MYLGFQNYTSGVPGAVKLTVAWSVDGWLVHWVNPIVLSYPAMSTDTLSISDLDDEVVRQVRTLILETHRYTVQNATQFVGHSEFIVKLGCLTPRILEEN